MLADLGFDTSTVGPVYAKLLSLDYHDRYGELELPPQQRKSFILQTLVEHFVHRAGRVTLLLIVEDAHWIDPTTTELLDALLAPINRAPVMLLVTHRPSWKFEWPSAYGHVLPLSIGALAQPLVADMVRNIVGLSANARLVNEIIDRSDGIPLFIEEMARFLAEREASECEIKMVLPATLQGSLLARLDRCEPVARETAQIASVIGREFSQDLLTRVCQFPSADLDAAVAELMAAHLLLRAGSSEDTFVFRHALIQDAAYQSLLVSKRQRYHAAIARALVEYREIAETQPELIARHFSEAALPELALPFWRRAGDRAIARSANYEAIDHYEKVLAIAQKLPDAQGREVTVLETKIALGWAQIAAGDLRQASATFADSAREARAVDKPDALANSAIGFAQANFYSHDPLDSSINLLLEALPAIEAKDTRQCCQILSALGRAFYMNGDLERADASNSKAIEIARRIDDDRTLCEALFNPLLVPAALSGKQSQSLLKRLGELLGIAERLNDADFRTRALATRIYYCAEFGDREGMIGALDTFCSLIEGQQMTHQQWVGQHGRAMLALLDGDFAAAEGFAENAYQLGRRRYGDETFATWVGEYSPRDLATAAYDEVSKRLPKPEPVFAPQIDRQIVNIETYFGATPIPVQSVDASVPGMWTTVTATPVALELNTGSIVRGDTTHISCEPWGSTEEAVGGCSWTPIWPSVRKTTGTDDHRYHGTLDVVWDITWTSSTGAGGTLDQLTTTTPVLLGVGEIQIIGGT